MNNNKRLVFGSPEAQEIIEQAKKNDEQKRLISLLNVAISDLEDISELIVSVGQCNGVEPKLWELADWVNTLMVDAKIDNHLSGTIEDASEEWNDVLFQLEKARKQLDNDNPSDAYDIVAELLDKPKGCMASLEKLALKFSY